MGYGCAALITPGLAKRLGKPAWMALLLASGGVVMAALGETFSQPAFLVIGFWLNLVGQGVAICATTIVQEQVEDAFRGRVFAFYDMTFNITFVCGAALSAAFMPDSGRSPLIIALVAAGYLVAAAAYWLVGRESSGGGGSLPGGGPDIPFRSAQSSSS